MGVNRCTRGRKHCVQRIINTMLNIGLYPNLWKQAEVRHFPKSKSPKVYKDYRPVSLLFQLGKIAEQMNINKMRSKLAEIIKPN